jgi:hypothetical protein
MCRRRTRHRFRRDGISEAEGYSDAL